MNKKSLYQFPIITMLSLSLLLVACGEEERNITKNDETVEHQNNTKNVEKESATQTEEKTTSTEKVEQEETEERDAGGYFVKQQKVTKEHYEKGILIANKVYPMPQDFAPGENQEAREAFNKMNAQAIKAGFELDAFSTYRSYDRQVELYTNYVARDGKEAADTYSARPGFSEHQTGLAFDIGEVGNPGDYADDRFGETEAGKWVAAHAHEFGFIMRYPQGKAEITGYKYESWHFRYVGKDIATKIYKDNSTLEEYLGVKG